MQNYNIKGYNYPVYNQNDNKEFVYQSVVHREIHFVGTPKERGELYCHYFCRFLIKYYIARHIQKPLPCLASK